MDVDGDKFFSTADLDEFDEDDDVSLKIYLRD